MHIKKIKTRQAWTTENELELVKIYFNMLQKQENGEKFVKSHIMKALAAKQGRSVGSCEAKMMNCSAIADKRGFKIVKGYKMLSKYGKSLEVNFEQFVRTNSINFNVHKVA